MFDMSADRMATVVADGEVRCAGMTAWEFRPFIIAHPEVAWTMLASIAARLRNAEERAEVVRRLDFCWRRGGNGADCVGDEEVREVRAELRFGRQRRERAGEGERLYCDVLPERPEGTEHRAAQDAREVIGQQKGVAILIAINDAPQFIGMSTTYL